MINNFQCITIKLIEKSQFKYICFILIIIYSIIKYVILYFKTHFSYKYTAYYM